MPGGIPRITNETLAETREEVLKGAKKFIYPLQHSKHRVVLLSSLIGLAALLVFFSYSLLALYRYKSTNTFIYRVTQVVPFPIARVGGRFVPYEEYLFEMRQYMHYFQTQEKLDFSKPENKSQLENQRKEALKTVINREYIKRLARQNKITVSASEIDAEIANLESQNRLGSDNTTLKDVIRDYYGWTINDFRRSIADKLLAVKVLDKLDTETRARAEQALSELKAGKDFAEVAKAYSDDAGTKANGGDIAGLIDKQDRNFPAQMTAELYKLQPGQYSGIFNIGYALEIVKNVEVKDGKIHAAYILFNYKDLQSFINAEQAKVPAQQFVRF